MQTKDHLFDYCVLSAISLQKPSIEQKLEQKLMIQVQATFAHSQPKPKFWSYATDVSLMGFRDPKICSNHRIHDPDCRVINHYLSVMERRSTHDCEKRAPLTHGFVLLCELNNLNH